MSLPRRSLPSVRSLSRSIGILPVADDPDIRECGAEQLSLSPLYSVRVAPTAKEALNCLLTVPNIHVCLYDLGLADLCGDRLHLLRKFAMTTAFIVITGSHSAEDGFAARELGAVALLPGAKNSRSSTTGFPWK